MDPKNHDQQEKIIDLEDLHRQHFPPPSDEQLGRIVTIQRERRIRRQRYVDTVVTYGAYEEAI